VGTDSAPLLRGRDVPDFIYQVARLWKDNRMTRADWQWVAKAPAVMMKRDVDVPEPGRFNGGQKILFKLLLLFMLLLLASGIMMWRPYFAHQFAIDWIRVAALVHAVSAFFLVSLVLGHTYMVLWTPGSMFAITAYGVAGLGQTSPPGLVPGSHRRQRLGAGDHRVGRHDPS